ncbi:Pol protein [Phytophthora palmivora]|uniref:Pol protein n=1 Tax=Phytophthora palmivora TaxID=4796 RepID=A0A2P4XUK2_9STRA|nr:Pol protein [Phytophthora palmivora]
MPDGYDQAGNIGPQAGNVVPQAGHIVPQTDKAVGEDAESASGVGNIVPRGVKKTSTSAQVSSSTSRVDNQVPYSESETPPARPTEDQYHVFDGVSDRQVKTGPVHLQALPEVSALLNLEELSMKDFLAELKAGEKAEIVLLMAETSPEDLNSSSVMDEDILEGFTKQRATCLGSEILKNPGDPVYPLVKEYSDVVSEHPPSQLPPGRGRCEVINAFFAEKVKSGMLRESKSPHSTPTFCVRKPNGKWRLVHAYNKLNNATVPAHTPIPRKDVLLNNMSGCTLYCALDRVDGYYQILMRESDIPLTAVSTPSGMLWEWLVMSHGLSNIPETFNRLVTQLFRPLRTFEQTYFDDIFVHSRAEDGQTSMEVHLRHLRRVFEVLRANKLYANIDKCVFAAEEIKVLGCFVSRKDADWVWERQHEDAIDSIKASLQHAPALALPDENKSFSVVCDASDYAIGCELLQKDNEGRERVISFRSRQLKAAGRNYTVHDMGLLAMKYDLVKFRVQLLGSRPIVIYTDHASLRTATNSPHLSQQIARWLSFFAEYNFRVEYKPGKLNVLADALSRRPDYELAHVSRVTTDLYDRISLAYQEDENYTPLVQFLSDGKDAKVDRLSPRQRAQLHRYELADGLLHYRVDLGDPPRVVVPHDEDLKYDILMEAHDGPISGHLGREKTYQAVSQTFRWSRMYKWVAHYVKTFSDRDPRFTGAFWDTLFQQLRTKLTMPTADHPETDGQTERVNRVLEDTLRSICAERPRSWSDQLSMIEFALNNAVHASTRFTPFYSNGEQQVEASLHRTTFAVLARHGAAYTIDLPKSMATHPTFYVGRLKRYHDPLGPPSQMGEAQDWYPRESYEGYDGTEWEELGDRSSAVNAPMEFSSLTTKSVQVLTKDLKGTRLASLRGSLTTRSKTKGYLDCINAISKLTDLVA